MYHFFIPRVYKILIVDKGAREEAFADDTIYSTDKFSAGDMGVFSDGDHILVVLSKPLGWEAHHGKSFEKMNFWAEVTVEDYQAAIRELDLMGVKQMNKIKNFFKDAKAIGDFNAVVMGTTPGYWHQSTVEINRDSSSVHTLEDLHTRDMFHTMLSEMKVEDVEIYSNVLQSAKAAFLYHIPNISSDKKHLGTFLISVDVDKSKVTGYEDVSEIEYFMGETLTNLTLAMSRFVAITGTYEENYKLYSQRASNIKKKALKLRKNVSQILVSGGGKGKPSEEEMLRDAATNFASCTDILYNLGDLTSEINLYRENMRVYLKAMGLTGTSRKELVVGQSFYDDIDRKASNAISRLENLLNNLQNSERSMRNSLELLKTYLESEQRASAERSGRAVNLLTIIFAAYGITDTISNFMIYYLEHHNETGFSYTQMFTMFTYTMLFPTILLILAYYFYLRRKW